MPKVFNVTGACRPAKHYMVNLSSRLEKIKSMIDVGDYFTINRARQYGKTTILRQLAEYLKDEYIVISLDFQKMSSADFADESSFVNGLARETGRVIRRFTDIPTDVKEQLKILSDKKRNPLEWQTSLTVFLTGVRAPLFRLS